MARKKKSKKIFKIYNIAILICIILILVGLYIVFKPEEVRTTASGLEVVEANIGETKEITEGKAKAMAIKQFKKLGEIINEKELKVMKIQRKGEEYYYISSKENTLEIKLKGGKVTRINSATVEE